MTLMKFFYEILFRIKNPTYEIPQNYSNLQIFFVSGMYLEQPDHLQKFQDVSFIEIS